MEMTNVCRANVSSFDELLIRDESLRVHYRNIHYLAIEMSDSFIAEILRKREFSSHNVVSGLRNQTEFYNNNKPKTVYCGTETLRSLGHKIWNILPSNIKTTSNHVAFKINIKKWIPTNCRCILCKQYQSGFGFIYFFL